MSGPFTSSILIVATKGRPNEAAKLLTHIGSQYKRPDMIVVVGTVHSDVALVSAGLPYLIDTSIILSASAGITVQRNEGIRWAINNNFLNRNTVVIFFDDDFRPAPDWIEQCLLLMNSNTDIAGLSGLVLADGAQSGAIDEEEAEAVLSGAVPPKPHWTSGPLRETASVYGCNMAFTGTVMLQCEFDENLPLYSWQEDRDMTGQAALFGRVILSPKCRGVHLGSKGGRTSGLRFGYSQIANMFYLAKKGTIDSYQLRRFIFRSLISNIIRSVYTKRNVDYRGRLRGNLLAFWELFRGYAHPKRILDL